MMLCRVVITVVGLLSLSVLATRHWTWEGGTNTPSEGVSFEFSNIDTSEIFAYLTVDIYQSESSHCIIAIKVFFLIFLFNYVSIFDCS